MGEVAERLKAHAWKACLGKPNVGSNPTLSAIIEKSLKSRAGSESSWLDLNTLQTLYVNSLD